MGTGQPCPVTTTAAVAAEVAAEVAADVAAAVGENTEKEHTQRHPQELHLHTSKALKSCPYGPTCFPFNTQTLNAKTHLLCLQLPLVEAQDQLDPVALTQDL